MYRDRLINEAKKKIGYDQVRGYVGYFYPQSPWRDNENIGGCPNCHRGGVMAMRFVSTGGGDAVVVICRACEHIFVAPLPEATP